MVAVKFVPAPDESALARFLVEARAAARVQHPNVVTLYRVGELDGRPFLVSEHATGASLDTVPKPVPRDRVLEIGLGLARGLGAAHRNGVLHRDLKPGNVIVGEDGVVKLLDFGLARLDRATTQGDDGATDEAEENRSPVGTPHYMAPEAWQGDPGSPRSDLWSLGAVLYELATGRAPHRGVARGDLPRVSASVPAAPVADAAPALDAGLAEVIDRCLRIDPAGRYASADELLTALLALRSDANRGAIPEGNPFRGLQAFDAAHRALFFGRRREVDGAIERLRNEGFLLVTGDSGVGKSSLCFAGVLPRIEEGVLEDGRTWTTLRMVPGRSPVTSLAAALSGTTGSGDDETERAIRETPEALLRALRAAVGTKRGVALYVDQLEELATVASREDAAIAGQALGTLAAGLPGIRVLGSVRSDFLTRVATLPGLGEMVPRAILLLRPLSADGVREAIVGPVRAKGARFESDALVETLVASTASADGSLPLLQFALAELWEARQRRDGRDVITEDALSRMGGVSGALAMHADAALDALLPAERTAARRILLRLVTDEGTRARRTEAELVGVDPASRAALEAIVRARLVVAREADAATTFEITHEALLSGWQTLARWLEEAAESRAIQSRLAVAVREWERRGRGDEGLWSAKLLREVKALDRGGLTAAEIDFVEASARGAWRARWLRRGAALTAVGAVVAMWGFTRWEEARERAAAVRTHFSDAATRRAAGAERRADLERLQAAALAHYDAGRKKEGDSAWREAVAIGAAVETEWSAAAEAFEKALAVDPGEPRVGSEYASFLYERALAAEAAGRNGLLEVLLSRMRSLDRDGSLRARWDAPATLDVEPERPDLELSVIRVRAGADGRRNEEAPRALGRGPLRGLSLPAGDHVLVARAPDGSSSRLPVRLRRRETRSVRLTVPAKAVTPFPMVYVPEGRFLHGSGAQESIREFFNAVPIHEVETAAYFIARDETTYADWIAFLEALPPAEQARRRPRVGSTSLNGQLWLERDAGGRWSIRMKPNERVLTARAGESIRYPGRERRAEQDWLRFPVGGVSSEDAEAYAAWLRESGRLPGARLCTEREWERTARGADDREYPHGDRLLPDDANFDETYGKNPLSFGPDEVGSHPASRSPFGVDDLAGNVWEWVRSDFPPATHVARGGSYYFAASTARTTNRETPEATFRDLTVGVRICADAS